MQKISVILLLCVGVSIIGINKAMTTKTTKNAPQQKMPPKVKMVKQEVKAAEDASEDTEQELSEMKDSCPVCVLNKKLSRSFGNIANLSYNYISALFNNPMETPPIVSKIDSTYTALAELLSSYYGNKSKDKLVEIFTQQNEQFAQLARDVKEDNKQLLKNNMPNMTANAKSIASMVASYNSKANPLEITSQFETLYTLLLNAAVNRFNGDWETALDVYDDITIAGQELASTFASDIIDAYPARFK